MAVPSGEGGLELATLNRLESWQLEDRSTAERRNLSEFDSHISWARTAFADLLSATVYT